jgi:hypothetical protein
LVQIISSTPCSQTPSAYVPPLMSDQVSHPCKTTGKIIVLYILSSRQIKRFWTEW